MIECSAIREAKRAKESGEETVILTALCGHGHFDLKSYEAFLAGELVDYDYPEEKVAAARMGEPEQFTFKGWNDETVYAYVVKPVDFDPGKKYPVAFLIHGGPQGSFGNDFHYRWNPQTYAGQGFAAVMIDFHGSTGYGQDFTDAINGDWGGAPYEDLMKGLDALLASEPAADGERACALGASYGGYMINWMHGQPFARNFKAFVTHDGNLDERMAYFDTEELWFPEWEHGGAPWEKDSGYDKHNPVYYVQNWHVPTLVVHGALDYRVPLEHGIGAFTALQRKGVSDPGASQFLAGNPVSDSADRLKLAAILIAHETAQPGGLSPVVRRRS